MAQYDHLTLTRVSEPVNRRKQPGPRNQPERKHKPHSKKISEDIEKVVEGFATSSAKDAINPALIMKVVIDGFIADDEWAKIDLMLLTHTDDNAVVLFSSDEQLSALSSRVRAYGGEKPEKQKNQPHASFMNAVSSLQMLSADDRIGPVLRNAGFVASESFKDDTVYLLDVEIWRPSDDLVDVFIHRVITPFEGLGGEELGRYTPPSGVLLRVEGPGQAIRQLLEREEVATVDLPPRPDLSIGGSPDPDITEIGERFAPPESGVRIGVVDTGVNSGHPLLEQVVIGSFGVAGEPSSDENGHGTAVSAIAAYGDIESMLAHGELRPRFQIASARVVNAHGGFSDKELAPEVVEVAIRRLNSEFNCRVVNLSLCDKDRPVKYRGSLWSEVLDDLARELDIVIVVAAGNNDHSSLTDAHEERIVDIYPAYLHDAANRILDPSGALNVLTVGSLAHVNGLSEEDGVEVRPLAAFNEPSPFTTVGPGTYGAIKPDLVDYGGTAVFDGLVGRLRSAKHRPATGVLSLHHEYTERLFSTFSGTSFAAPLIAHKAALLLQKFPEASANTIRCLLAISAEQPAEAMAKLGAIHPRHVGAVLGYGHSDIESALFSEDGRVVLTAQGSLVHDQFAIYEVPMVEEFQETAGTREIRVALAFDPPVRRTRKDYIGVQMQFDLIRGSDVDTVFHAYRELQKDDDGKLEDTPPGLAGRQYCVFSPSINLRKVGTLQCGTFTARQNITKYGDTYFLVVRCVGRWAEPNEEQAYSLAVMLRHSEEMRLYEQLRERLTIRV